MILKFRILKKILVILLIIITSSCSKEEKVIPNSIEFSTNRVLPLIEVTINDTPATLLIDTGASFSMIDYNLAKKFNFYVNDSDEMTVSGIGGMKDLYFTKNVKVFYKEEPMYIRFKAADLSNVRSKLGISGVIGSDYLLQNNLVIDYKNKVLRKSEEL